MSPYRLIMSIVGLLALAGCGTQRAHEAAARPAAEVTAQIVQLLPAKTIDRSGWASDIYAAFAAQNIPTTPQSTGQGQDLCDHFCSWRPH